MNVQNLFDTIFTFVKTEKK